MYIYICIYLHTPIQSHTISKVNEFLYFTQIINPRNDDMKCAYKVTWVLLYIPSSPNIWQKINVTAFPR